MTSDDHEAMYYEKLDGGQVRCQLCPHSCLIQPGRAGICRQRANEDGTLVSHIYGRATSTAMDPIEKKPLYHFHPGEQILSLGTNGCNFACLHCQNWSISQEDGRTQMLSPQQAVDLAVEGESFGIAYTYNEPLIWYEYVLDTSKLAHERGLKNVLVTNGFIQQEPLRELLPFIDALNIDIKSIRDEFYKEICRGRVGPVLETAKTAKGAAHVEVTNLIIPTYNDSDSELTDLADWVHGNLGEDTPTHLSAYVPRFKLSAPPTPPETLKRAYAIFARRLQHVYLGNVTMGAGSDTLCPDCGSTLIERHGYTTRVTGLDTDACKSCGEKQNIVV